MREIVVAGNWKMNKDLNESVALVSEIKNLLSDDINAKMIVCPPYTSLETVNALIKNTNIGLGAQNMCSEDSGAYTGAISASMIKSIGCEYVILGHSERRTIFGESDELVNSKIKKALEYLLIPIFCIGETLEERESGEMKNVIGQQVKEGLKGISADQLSQLIVAYEPVWAIGTGKTASPEQAQEVHGFIRGLLAEMYSSDFAEKVTIQYGGSVKPDNAKELLGQPDIDGALVGGACLNADSFIGIAKAV